MDKPLSYPILVDENIHPGVIAHLKQGRKDIQTLQEVGLTGKGDRDILRYAYEDKRVVQTHDSDFGWLAIAQDQPFMGIIYLRPGHIKAEFTIETLQVIEAQDLDVVPPFIVVAERIGNIVKIRIRLL